MNKDSLWQLVYKRYDPQQEGLKEALCTLGNGYFATRGAIPEALASNIHYPGTYIAGLYNRLVTHIAGQSIAHENIVNCPNWIFLTFKIGNGEWFYPSLRGILSYHQKLDMKKGILSRRLRVINRKGQRTLIETQRLIHITEPHLAAVSYVITPENYSDWIKVRTMLDGTVTNSGVERYKKLSSKHLKPFLLGKFSRNGIFLSVKTNASDIEVAEASKIRIFSGQKQIQPAIRSLTRQEDRIGQEFRVFLRKKERCRIEKTLAIYTSKDTVDTTPAEAAILALQKVQRFKTLAQAHQSGWDKLWKRFDIQIKGDDFSQRVLRLYMFHLLQTASLNNIKLDVGVPARGLHGEAYGGHIFWDEIFVMPFYNLHLPQVSKGLLLYRWRRLPQARENARKLGYRGAMFPWQSASSGMEETQPIHLNPLSGVWGPDHSSLQRHVSFAIAYNVWQYYKTSADFDFLIDYGAEMILAIADFASGLAVYDARDGRYHTEGLMGPDEFHESLPGSGKPGLKDNAYTNLMIVWILLKAEQIINLLPEGNKAQILKKLKLSQKDFSKWQDITRKMNLVINERGIIAQFDGYFGLKELDWVEYKSRYGNIQRLDRILKAEGESPDDYKVSKQADLLMFFYLVSFAEAKRIFARLGYRLEHNLLKKNFQYYFKRTSHGSTLSKVVYSYIAQLLGDKELSGKLFSEALEADIYDSQGGTTKEGIHTGLMAGCIDIVIRNFAGISALNDNIEINPCLPSQWQAIKLRLRHKERWISLAITPKQIAILIQGPHSRSRMITAIIKGKKYTLGLGKTYKIK